MKPTISNAFNDEPVEPGATPPPATTPPSSDIPAAGSWKRRKPAGAQQPNPRRSLAASLSAMQVDLRNIDFGWSLELSPMTAIDVLAALGVGENSLTGLQFLVSMEQTAWREGDADMPVAEIAKRLAIPVIERLEDDQLVLDEIALRQLVSLCQPTRLLAVAVEGAIDGRDAKAINQAFETGRSPLVAELRARAALEVMGDRSVVLHCRDKELALRVVAENFRHYLAALQRRAAAAFDAPETWQLDRLLGLTGSLTVRPIETQVFSTSIDVGINTSKERFGQPADRSLIYDVPSNTWHDEP